MKYKLLKIQLTVFLLLFVGMLSPSIVSGGYIYNSSNLRYSDEVSYSENGFQRYIRFQIKVQFDLQYSTTYCSGNSLYGNVDKWRSDYIRLTTQIRGLNAIGHELKIIAFSFDIDVKTGGSSFHNPVQYDKTVNQWVDYNFETVDTYTYWVDEVSWRNRAQNPDITIEFPTRETISIYNWFWQENPNYNMNPVTFGIPSTVYLGQCI